MSILGLLLAGTLISTAVKVGILVVATKTRRARQRQRAAQAAAAPAAGTPDSADPQNSVEHSR